MGDLLNVGGCQKKVFGKISPRGNLGYGNRCWLSARGGNRERGGEAGSDGGMDLSIPPFPSNFLLSLIALSLFCDALFSSSSSSFPSAINLRIFRQRQSPSPSSSSSSSSLLPAFLLCMYNNNMGLGGEEGWYGAIKPTFAWGVGWGWKGA